MDDPTKLDAIAESVADEPGERGIGLDRDERVGAEFEEALRRLARAGADLENPCARPRDRSAYAGSRT